MSRSRNGGWSDGQGEIAGRRRHREGPNGGAVDTIGIDKELEMCRAGGGGREDGVASAGAEGCWVGESCQREVIQAGNDVRSPPSAWPRLVSTGQRGVFAIKWTALLVHKPPILRVN